MLRLKAHKISPQHNFVPAPPKNSKKNSGNSLPITAEPRSAIFDVIVEGAQEWQGKFHEYIMNTTWDSRHGYLLVKETPASRDTRLITGTAFDDDDIPFSFDSYEDLHGDEHENAGLGAGALGGGDEYSTGSDEV
jgi:hypothetical protein